MNQYKVTFERVDAFYQTILIEAESEQDAREKADQLSSDGQICFDFLAESDVLDEYILDIKKL